MTVVTVRAPGKVNRRIAGVAFSEGRAEVDSDSAAFQFFKRRGYKVLGESKPAEGEQPEDESTDGSEPEGEAPEESGEQSTGEQESNDEQEQDEDAGAERPHPVQGSKAVWFEYLTGIKPDHGFDLETVSRKDLIAAVEAIEAE